MDSLEWMKKMFMQELDLRPPSLAKINGNNIFIRDEEGNPIAHAIKTNRWNGHEINSFVIDPLHRGKGISHELLKQCGSGRLFAYTRDLRLQSALRKAGFKRSAMPGFLAILNMFIGRLIMIFWIVLSLEFRRLLHQLIHLPKYKLYIRE